jgi:hypothetical protein
MGKTINLGFFNTAEEASKAYGVAAERIVGDFIYGGPSKPSNSLRG